MEEPDCCLSTDASVLVVCPYFRQVVVLKRCGGIGIKVSTVTGEERGDSPFLNALRQHKI